MLIGRKLQFLNSNRFIRQRQKLMIKVYLYQVRKKISCTTLSGMKFIAIIICLREISRQNRIIEYRGAVYCFDIETKELKWKEVGVAGEIVEMLYKPRNSK